jgi:hypothetical protein
MTSPLICCAVAARSPPVASTRIPRVRRESEGRVRRPESPLFFWRARGPSRNPLKRLAAWVRDDRSTHKLEPCAAAPVQDPRSPCRHRPGHQGRHLRTFLPLCGPGLRAHERRLHGPAFKRFPRYTVAAAPHESTSEARTRGTERSCVPRYIAQACAAVALFVFGSPSAQPRQKLLRISADVLLQSRTIQLQAEVISGRAVVLVNYLT